MLEYLHALFLPEPFFFFLLQHGKLATVPPLGFSVHFGQELFLKYVAFYWFLHSLTVHAFRINRLLLLLLLYFNAAVFSVKSKRSYGPPRMLPFSRMFTFCWINNRPCKHPGTAPYLVKIISFKYFRESSHLKQESEHSFAVKCFPLPR